MKGTLEYYNISQLGIYKRASETHLFDNSDSEILDSLIRWFKQRPDVVNTCTQSANKAKGQSNVYCYDAAGSEGEYIFVLWNELTNAENEILTLPKASKPGLATVKAGLNSNDQIPGQPSYYWVSLNHGFVATIHFGHSMTTLIALRDYISGYVTNYSEFVVLDDKNPDKVVGYRAPSASNDSPKGYFKFRLKRKLDENTIEELSQNYKKITKIVRRTKKKVEQVGLDGFFHKLASRAIHRGLPKNRETHIEIELEFTPNTARDFERIVEAYENQITDPDKSNNLGFILKGGNGKTLFLNGCHKKDEHDFEIIRKNKNPFGATELLRYILRKQVRFVPQKKDNAA